MAAHANDAEKTGVADGSGDVKETRVEAARPIDSDAARIALGDAWLRGAPEDVLQGALGATLVHEGGPLAPVRPMLRGLSGARIAVVVGGLALTDPATGLIDAALFPWAAADAVVVDSGADAGGLGGGLRLELLRGPALRARVLAGSASTARASLAAADQAVLIAVDVGTSRGDFAYVPTSAVASPGNEPAQRSNNDRQRGSFLVGGHERAGDIALDALALAAADRGGIPGFAASPTRGLRGEEAMAGARVAATRRTGATNIALAVQGRAAHRATFGPEDARSTIDSGAARAQASLALRHEEWQLDLVSGAEHATLLGTSAARVPGGYARTAVDLGGAAGGALVFADTRLQLRSALEGRVTTDSGSLWGGALRAELGETLRAFVGIARASRAPTLDELHAPRGVVLGNPALRPEAMVDAELGLAVFTSPLAEARVVAFAGRIEDAIVYMNKNAFEIEPANVGAGWRAGADISIVIEPTIWLSLRAGAGVLASQMEVTHSPLPLAAPFTATTALRTGVVSGPTATLVVRSRASAPSNTFGTLEAAGYTLLDLLVRVPVAQRLALGCAVENALDALDARDANGLPLPGRLFFLSLEVSG